MVDLTPAPGFAEGATEPPDPAPAGGAGAGAPGVREPVPAPRPTSNKLAPTPADLATHAFGGRLRVRSGAWPDLERLLAGHLRFELLPAPAPGPHGPGGAPPRAPVIARLERVDDPSGETWIAFAFPPVVAGDYTLTTSSTDELRIVPERLAVDVPGPPVELWWIDDIDTLAIGFRVLDARTGAPLQDYSAWSVRTERDPAAGVLFHAGELALDAVPIDARYRWRLWAPGYQPASGDERAFVEEREGRWIAEVRLEPGWGRRFVVLGRTPAMQPLAGAQVRLDGVFVGRTDAAGELEAALPAPPERYEVTLGALRAAGPVPGDLAADRRAQVSVIILEPEGED